MPASEEPILENPGQELPLRSAPAAALAFVVAFATLMTQVLVHRMVTAKLLNNFAFVVISLTMLGFAASGALLTRRAALTAAPRLDRRLGRQVSCRHSSLSPSASMTSRQI